eukprot:644935_1
MLYSVCDPSDCMSWIYLACVWIQALFQAVSDIIPILGHEVAFVKETSLPMVCIGYKRGGIRVKCCDWVVLHEHVAVSCCVWCVLFIWIFVYFLRFTKGSDLFVKGGHNSFRFLNIG